MRPIAYLAALSALLAGAALAHQGVKDPQVKARMDLMAEIKEATRGLGNMARGKAEFDPATAADLKATLERLSREVEPAFEAPADDPTSEALPVIWEDPDAFSRTAEEMAEAAAELRVRSREGLQASFAALAKSCRSCHESYRIDK